MPTTMESFQVRALDIEYSAALRRAAIAAVVSTPITIYGFAGRATWAKTVGVLGLMFAGLCYVDSQRIDRERTAARGLVLS